MYKRIGPPMAVNTEGGVELQSEKCSTGYALCRGSYCEELHIYYAQIQSVNNFTYTILWMCVPK